MELFLSPKGSDKNKGSGPKDARLTLPSLTPDPKEPLMVWMAPGTVLGDLDLSGWAGVRIQPFVYRPGYGNDTYLIRDWKPGVGAKPRCKSLTIRGSGFAILHLDIEGTLDTRDLAGKKAAKEEEPDEPALAVLKGVTGKLWLADNWEVVQCTLDDIQFDEVKMAYGLTAKGVKDVILTENTGPDGKPKGNLRIGKWHPVKGKLEAGKRVSGDRLGRFRLTHGGKFLDAASGMFKLEI